VLAWHTLPNSLLRMWRVCRLNTVSRVHVLGVLVREESEVFLTRKTCSCLSKIWFMKRKEYAHSRRNDYSIAGLTHVALWGNFSPPVCRYSQTYEVANIPYVFNPQRGLLGYLIGNLSAVPL